MGWPAVWAAAGENNNNSADKNTGVIRFSGKGEAAWHNIVPENAVFFALPRPLVGFRPGKKDCRAERRLLEYEGKASTLGIQQE